MQTRIITALVLSAFLAFVLFALPWLFIPLIAVTLGIAMWEWCRISQIKQTQDVLLFAGLTVMLWILASNYWAVFILLLLFSVLHYLYVVYLIYKYETIRHFRIDQAYLLVGGACLLSALATSLVFFFRGDPAMLVFIIAMIVAADSGAYFIGRFWGKHPLVSKTSPKKTIEGLIGGLLSVVVIFLLAHSMVSWPFSTVSFLVITIISVLFSVVGDLFISVIKRQNNIKDSSQILPGHGGVLDRIDGLLAGIPVFCLIMFFSYSLVLV